MEENADVVPEPEPAEPAEPAPAETPAEPAPAPVEPAPEPAPGTCGGCCARDAPQAKRPPARQQEQAQTPENCAGTGATASRAPRASEG